MNDKTTFRGIDTNPKIIENYDLLKDIGILKEIDTLNNEIRNLEELLDEAIILFNQMSVFELVNYIAKKMLSKFIPNYLVFVIQDDESRCGANIICFKNLKEIDNIIDLESIEPYNKFFSLSPASITFDAFKHMIENERLSECFRPIDPQLLVPMMGHDGMYGFLVFGKKVIESAYSNQELYYIDKIMKFASVTLQNSIHYRKATVDSKTKLYNHSFFMRKLEEELSRVRRYNSTISLLMIDIDHFKIFNDTYGHLVGDRLLYHVSRLISGYTRKEDVAARFGGEEFTVMLVESNRETALIVAEKLRKIIEDFEIPYMDKMLKTTISIGISHTSKEKYNDATELIRQADVALYYSKENGRNKSSTYDKKFDD